MMPSCLYFAQLGTELQMWVENVHQAHWSSTSGLYVSNCCRVVAGALPVQLMFLAVSGAGIAAK